MLSYFDSPQCDAHRGHVQVKLDNLIIRLLGQNAQSKCHLPFPLKVICTVIMLQSFHVFYVLMLFSELRPHNDISNWCRCEQTPQRK